MQGVFFAAQKTGLLPTVEPTRLCQAGALHGQYVGQFGAMHGPCARRVGAVHGLTFAVAVARLQALAVSVNAGAFRPRPAHRRGLVLSLQSDRGTARHVCKMYRGTARSAHKTDRGTARHEKSSLSQCFALTIPNALAPLMILWRCPRTGPMPRQSLRFVSRHGLVRYFRKKRTYAPNTANPPQDPVTSEGHLGGIFFCGVRGFGPFFHAVR